MRVALNSLLGSDQFLVVRNLTLQNTSRVGPPISRGPSRGGPSAATHWDARRSSLRRRAWHPGAANDLNVILGRELVRASMRIEIIDFPTAEQPGK